MRRRVSMGAVVLVLILTLTAVSAAGCGGAANAGDGALKLTEADNGRTFTVKTGDTIEVVIAGNPTTGYEWTAVLDEASAALLEQVGEPVYAAESTDQTLVGGGGTYTFTFKALKSGSADLRLAYARAWENVDPIQTFTVAVTIE
jgi:inhibitor of cysteine peptidase